MSVLEVKSNEIIIEIKGKNGEILERHELIGCGGILIKPIPDIKSEDITVELTGDIEFARIDGEDVRNMKNVKINPKGGVRGWKMSNFKNIYLRG